MEFSEYENIEIFNNTQRFAINKYENQILRHTETDIAEPDPYKNLFYI
jgi:hypothetical protein